MSKLLRGPEHRREGRSVSPGWSGDARRLGSAAGRQKQITLPEPRPGQFLPGYIIKFVIFVLILSSRE